ncbi:flavodoxin [Prevotella falsenii]|uniref:flavodoxin n=1 Tax=Prevotella falsenii TaxID=515414 RepID=UPI000A6AD21A|nr:flavodoxin [Prevotella falsenii]
MNRIITAMAALLLMVGCKSNAKQNINREDKNMQKKVLVAYFSYSGTTKGYAEKIAKQAHADLFEIQAAQPYTDADVDWRDDNSRVNREMKTNPDSRPAIAKKVDNLKTYDVVFVGFPIWWYIAPNIINTFFETNDFKGKTIIPFFTSASSGPGETDKHLHKSINYNVTWKPAVRVNRWNDKELNEWVDKSIQ